MDGKKDLCWWRLLLRTCSLRRRSTLERSGRSDEEKGYVARPVSSSCEHIVSNEGAFFVSSKPPDLLDSRLYWQVYRSQRLALLVRRSYPFGSS